ncbi:MAG: N-acetylmuramoyl-L-alanine amidase [Armatimonadetes bacterium]|nr:N-acetylmuramoyl-L-alanine amidase [Armatimonadota bacterium]
MLLMHIAAALLVVLMTSVAAAADDATVRVDSHPDGAKIYVNGYFKGRTPATVTVSSATGEPKSYRFTLHLPGFKPWDLTLDLAAGQNKSIYATLERLPSMLAGKTICIDPGHPSETSAGCTGPGGTTENHINWIIALKLRDELEAAGATVVVTKQSENEKVTNRHRAEIANAAGADIMIRLHCDAASASGFSIYYPDRQGTRYGVTGPGQSVIDASRAAATPFYEGMKAALTGVLRGRGVHGDSATYIGSRQGALTGSIFSQVPVLTIEMVVLTNASDEAFITTQAGQEKMVEALKQGLENYFAALQN